MITIACASDAKFYPFAATMLCSAFEHTTDELVVYLLCQGISDKVLRTFQTFAQERGHRLQPVPLDTSSLASLRVDQHISLATYYRLLLPEVLPAELSRVIYLDSDLIVRRPLRALWEQETSVKGLAAVRDFHHDRPNEIRWNFPADRTYFNAGVLLIDLTAWRAGHTAQAVIDRVAREPEKMILWDQDGLNLVFADAWRELPLEWNVQYSVFHDPRMRARFADLASHPAIVHFTGSEKPWLWGATHPYTEEFLKYYALTPFKSDYRARPRTLRDRLRPMKRKVVSLYSTALPKVAAIERLWRNRPVREMTRLTEARQQRLRQRERREQENANQKIVRELIPDLTVRGGPFAGLKYDDSSMPGWLCGPKILGCYESELQPALDSWLHSSWDFVLNIGCGDGYHAVGFSRFQKAPVVAYDTDPQARATCERLARANGTVNQLEIRSAFTLRELERFDARGRGLIFCDGGGAEKHIFHPSVPGFARLATCDLLIELHDHLEPGVSSYIRDVFASTHELHFVPSVDDLIRPRVFPCAAIQSLSYGQQVQLQAEHRCRAIEWAVLQARHVPEPSPDPSGS